ncbi:histidine phosphatase family protein [Herbiconiux moechotypicola]|nr:histidine phosphatase family protein [Herbiconiux moechotypicola]MCS5729186.1 histidine phosphatase family protein [Herbiconiux moechotypicola]
MNDVVLAERDGAPPPPPLRIHLVRHGQTVLNAEEKLQGWHDSALTAEGLVGVRATAEALREVPFVAAYSSSSGRTVATAREILVHHPGVRLVVDERLRELHFGELESAPVSELVELGDPAVIFAGILDGSDSVFPGAESSRDYLDRVTAGFAAIEAAHPSGDVLVVGHGITLVVHLHRQIAGYDTLALENASVTTIERGPAGWMLG